MLGPEARQAQYPLFEEDAVGRWVKRAERNTIWSPVTRCECHDQLVVLLRVHGMQRTANPHRKVVVYVHPVGGKAGWDGSPYYDGRVHHRHSGYVYRSKLNTEKLLSLGLDPKDPLLKDS